MRRTARGLLLTLAFGAAACGSDQPPTSTAPPSAATIATTTAKAKPTATATATTTAAAPRPAPTALASLAKSSNAFGLALYDKIHQAPGNLALSPASISIALTMTWAGARGDTASEMQKVLHLEGAPDAVLKSAGELAAYLQDPARPLTLRIANRLFGEKSYSFERPYLDQTKAAFGAPLEAVDFVGATEQARGHINDWVSGETEQRIKELLPPHSLTADTRLVLVNALYFLAKWREPFDETSTRPAKFNLSATQSKDVPTMHRTGRFSTAAADGVKLLELPYKDESMALTIVLPDAVDGLGAVEKSLTPEAWAKWTGALQGEQVMVALPKFELNPEPSLSLADNLRAMGMSSAFDAKKADFTGIANPPKKDDRLSISQVFHKAFVKVDEKGTEAAAATAVVAVAGAGAPAKPRELLIDHPFLFFVRERTSGMILFMGRVTDPALH
jgi:serpin B